MYESNVSGDPNSVISIGYRAFGDCENHASIKIPDSVKEIGESTFYGCSNLRTVEMGNLVTAIGRNAFGRIAFGRIAFGRIAFGRIDILEHFYCNAINPPKCDRDAFKDSYPVLAALHVQEGTTDAYKSSIVWRNFKTIIDDITGVDDIAAEGNGISPESAVEVYDLNGVKMRVTKRAELQALPHGLYIVNGHKECVK